MEILRYNYDGKIFVAYLKDKKITFGIEKENSIIVNELTPKEDFIIRTIYNFIIGNKKYLLRLSNIKFNNKEFKVFYNMQNKLYTFYEINSQNQTYDIRTLERLNYIFNNQSGILLKDEEVNSQRQFKVLAKIGGIAVSVLVSGAIILSSFPNVPNNVTLFKADYAVDSLYKDISFQENSQYSIDKLLDTIDSNLNLNQEEKKFVKSIIKEVEENKDYIDFEQLNKNLSELNIKYEPLYNDDGTINWNLGTGGSYTYAGSYKNEISIMGDQNYNCSNFEDCDKSTLVHELNHLLNKRMYLLSISGKLGDSIHEILIEIGLNSSELEEMVNELFSREYLNYYTNQPLSGGYSWLMPAMYGLCEVLDEETLRKYKFDSDNFYITQYLSSLGVEMEDIYDLYKSLDLLYDLKYSVYVGNTEDKAIYSENNKKIYNIIKECYEKKNGIPMENDLNMLLYFYDTDYVDEEFNENVRKILNVEKIEKIIPKGYVAEKYIDENPGVTVVVDSELDKKVIITEENRYINKQHINNKSVEDFEEIDR